MSQRLVRIDVTSKMFAGGIDEPRRLVRRYHLAYDAAFHATLLKTVQMEGRCAQSEHDAPSEDAREEVGATSCSRLPPIVFDYQHVLPFDSKGQVSTRDLDGFDGFDERIHHFEHSPNHSVDEEVTDLFDINADGLPDVLVTAPALFNGRHGVFFNGRSG